MKKALFYGILASFFFAFTFLLNRSMHLAGGYWLWSACLRIFLPFLSLLRYWQFQEKAKDKASFTYLGRNNKSSRRMVSLEQCWFCTVLCAFNFWLNFR